MPQNPDQAPTRGDDIAEMRRYLRRLTLIIAAGALVMLGLGLYLYSHYGAERAETTRRVPTSKQVGPAGSVRYVPVPGAGSDR